MSLSVTGKTAIVTGAANGVGLAIARHFVDKGAHVMFADMELIGVPHQIIIGERNLDENKVEYKNRRSGEKQLMVLNQIADFVSGL